MQQALLRIEYQGSSCSLVSPTIMDSMPMENSKKREERKALLESAFGHIILSRQQKLIQI